MTPSQITDIIAQAIVRGQSLGYSKPHDLATAVKVDLTQAGLKIVKAPKRVAP
jgi:hypothetical protein